MATTLAFPPVAEPLTLTKLRAFAKALKMSEQAALLFIVEDWFKWEEKDAARRQPGEPPSVSLTGVAARRDNECKVLEFPA